jgi:hypothetical protein
MFSFSTCRLVLLVSAACSAVTSAELTVVLGGAADYAILAKTGISTVPSSYIYGDIAVSPIDSASMTGFSFTLDDLGQYSDSTQLLASTGGDPNLNHPGNAFSASYGPPISDVLTTAVVNMENAYTDAANRVNPDDARINYGAGDLGGAYGGAEAPLTPGVYTFGSNVKLTGDVHFWGAGVFIIQITGNLVQAADSKVIMEAGARPENIFWQVAGVVEVGADAHMQGVILAKTKVDFITRSSLTGRVLTQTACNLQQATITEPNTEPIEGIEGSSYMESFFELNLKINGDPEDEDIIKAVDLFVSTYNNLMETYENSDFRHMDTATAESITPGNRRLDHPQQESRQLQMTYYVYLRAGGSCWGCPNDDFWTNQTRRREKRLLDELLPGLPDEDTLLAAYSSQLTSNPGDYGNIVDAVSLAEVE